MKTIGLFDAKTRLSEICDTVATTQHAVIVTRRGQPLVTIQPIRAETVTIRERRVQYLANRGKREKPDRTDFEPAARSAEVTDFGLGE